VAFVVPECHLIFGERLVLVGSCQQLGAWDPKAAPALNWQAGDTWSAQVRMPPGNHTFKLCVLRQDGAWFFEEGPDRELEVPVGAAAVAAKAGTGLLVTCRFGDAVATDITLATPADLARAAPAPPPPGALAGADSGASQLAPPEPAKLGTLEALAQAAQLLGPESGSRNGAVPRPQWQAA
jgi:hypothetical protein